MSNQVHSAASGSIPVADVSGLIAKLEAAQAGSNAAVDCLGDLRAALGFGSRNAKARYVCWSALGGCVTAALSLCARKIPSWATDVHTADGSVEKYPIRKDIVMYDDGSAEVRISYQHPKIEPREIGVGYHRSSLALAVCIAALEATHHRDEAGGGVNNNPEATND